MQEVMVAGSTTSSQSTPSTDNATDNTENDEYKKTATERFKMSLEIWQSGQTVRAERYNLSRPIQLEAERNERSKLHNKFLIDDEKKRLESAAKATDNNLMTGTIMTHQQFIIDNHGTPITRGLKRRHDSQEGFGMSNPDEGWQQSIKQMEGVANGVPPAKQPAAPEYWDQQQMHMHQMQQQQQMTAHHQQEMAKRHQIQQQQQYAMMQQHQQQNLSPTVGMPHSHGGGGNVQQMVTSPLATNSYPSQNQCTNIPSTSAVNQMNQSPYQMTPMADGGYNQMNNGVEYNNYPAPSSASYQQPNSRPSSHEGVASAQKPQCDTPPAMIASSSSTVVPTAVDTEDLALIAGAGLPNADQPLTDLGCMDDFDEYFPTAEGSQQAVNTDEMNNQIHSIGGTTGHMNTPNSHNNIMSPYVAMQNAIEPHSSHSMHSMSNPRSAGSAGLPQTPVSAGHQAPQSQQPQTGGFNQMSQAIGAPLCTSTPQQQTNGMNGGIQNNNYPVMNGQINQSNMQQMAQPQFAPQPQQQMHVSQQQQQVVPPQQAMVSMPIGGGGQAMRSPQIMQPAMQPTPNNMQMHQHQMLMQHHHQMQMQQQMRHQQQQQMMMMKQREYAMHQQQMMMNMNPMMAAQQRMAAAQAQQHRYHQQMMMDPTMQAAHAHHHRMMMTSPHMMGGGAVATGSPVYPGYPTPQAYAQQQMVGQYNMG